MNSRHRKRPGRRAAAGEAYSPNGRTFRTPLLWVLILATASATAAHAGSIFDDDWTPPKRALPVDPTEPKEPKAPAPRPAPRPAATSAPPAASVPRPPRVAATPPTLPPLPPLAPPVVGAPPASLRGARRPIPSPVDQAKSRKLLKAVYVEQLKDQSVAGRRKFAQILLGDVPKCADNPTDQFVLLGGALEAALDGSSLPLCFQVAEETAKAYDVDGLLIKAEAASKVLSKPGPAAVENARAGLELVGQLLNADEDAAAGRVVAVLQQSTAGDASLQKAAQQRKQEVDAARAAREKLAQQFDKLKTSPNDPSANSAAGAYLCFFKGEWDRGLPMLAKGSDEPLKALASAELAKPTGAEAIALLADGWWGAAGKQPAPAAARVLQHAGKLYRQALTGAGGAGGGPGVTGLRRKLIQQRLAELPADVSPSVNLLALLDPRRDSVTGAWQMQNGTLVSASSWKGRVEFPYVPPEEYDYRVVFVFKQVPPSSELPDRGHDGTRLICYAGGRQFGWVLGAHNNRLTWIDQVNGFGSTSGNPTLKQSPAWVLEGRHTCLVKVRYDGVEAYLDGVAVCSLQTNFANLSLWDGDRLRRTNTLGLGAWKDSITVESAEVLAVSGEGRALAPDAGLAPDAADGPSARGREAIMIGAGAWEVSGEELAQTSPDRSSALVFGNPTWSRYNLTLKAKAVEGREGFRVMFHSVDMANFCRLDAGAVENQKHHVLVSHDLRVTRAQATVRDGAIERDRWYDVRLEVRGDECKCFLDGEKLFVHSSPRLTQGRVGLACGATSVRFRDIRVTSEDGNTVFWKGPPRLPVQTGEARP